MGFIEFEINDIALDYQEELLPHIIAFNDALTLALREMYDKPHRHELPATQLE